MPLREATWKDLIPASKVLAKAFAKSGLFSIYMHPYQDQYPDDPYLYWLHDLRADYFAGPDHRIIVTFKDETDTRITGAAVWIRKRSKPQSPGIHNEVMTKAMHAYNYLESFIYPNRAAEPSRLDFLDRTEPYSHHHWTGTRADSWYLSRIGVDPTAEKRGYGRQMVKYGFDLAKEEGIGCSVIAAPGKESFYHACGFDVDVGTTGDHVPDGHELKTVEVATIHFWDNGIDPKGIKKYGEE
jgi:GNAT superfamily N-acetyltransferase